MRKRRNRFFRDDVLAPWFALGVILGIWWLGARVLRPSASTPAREESPVTIIDLRRDVAKAVDRPAAPAAADPAPADDMPDATPVMVSGDVGELLQRRLLVPVVGAEVAELRSTFSEKRGSSRVHEAMDILAPRGTPVVAADDGKIAKLFTSAAGGLTIYQFDPSERLTYYYAHLNGYADVREGQQVTRGQTIGYVGTTGNAPPGTPHLHFAIFKLGPEKKWWDGAPIDPYLVLR